MSARPSEHDPVAKYLLLGATAFLTVVGLVMIYSASSVADLQTFGDTAHHLKSQALYAVIGVILLLVLSRIDYRHLRALVIPSLVIADALCAVVFALGYGKWGATRWLDLGPINVQPSEIAKVAVVASVALLLSATPPHRRTATALLLPLGLIVIPAAALIMLQPDMGTTMAMIVAVVFVLWIGDFDRRSFLVTLFAVASVVPIAVIAAPYRFRRLTAFIAPWASPKGDGYQIIQAMYAFGSGGWHGVGLGLSRQKFFYLPAAHTDFIFAIIGEELGLIGALAIVVGFAVLAYAGLRIAQRTPDRFGRLLAGGVIISIASQAAMNMLAVTGLMPITGIPLPLVSFGGSSMVLNLACLGLVLSVYRHGRVALPRAASKSRSVRAEEHAREGLDEWRRDGRSHLSGVDGGRRASR